MGNNRIKSPKRLLLYNRSISGRNRALFLCHEIKQENTDRTEKNRKIRKVENTRANIPDSQVHKIRHVFVVQEPVNEIAHSASYETAEEEEHKELRLFLRYEPYDHYDDRDYRNESEQNEPEYLGKRSKHTEKRSVVFSIP
jgi:hypothetical protein